jgi:ribulose-bisphosphate carboxylase large chain
MLDQNWYNIHPTLPVASGGLSPLHIPELMRLLGKDMVYQFGGGCHGHPNGTTAGAKAIRQAVDAVLEGRKLKEYAKSNPELAK